MIACCLVGCKSLFHRTIFFLNSFYTAAAVTVSAAMMAEAEAVRVRAYPAAADVGTCGALRIRCWIFSSLSFQGHKSFFFLSLDAYPAIHRCTQMSHGRRCGNQLESPKD